jgi:hypothetical protein
MAVSRAAHVFIALRVVSLHVVVACSFQDFMIPVQIGSQVFHLLVDTGSTSLAVAGVRCTTCSNASPVYTPGPTAQPTGQTTKAEYGDGSSLRGESGDTTWRHERDARSDGCSRCDAPVSVFARVYTDSVSLLSGTGASLTPAVRMRFASITSAPAGGQPFFSLPRPRPTRVCSA